MNFNKTVISVTTTAVLLASVAAPAFAGEKKGHFKEKEKEGRGWAIGKMMPLGMGGLFRGLRLGDDKDLRPVPSGYSTSDLCLNDAKSLRDDAVATADDARDAALRTARRAQEDTMAAATTAKRQALTAARRIRSSSVLAALTAYQNAATTDSAALTTLQNSLIAAETAFQSAKTAAETAFQTAKTAANTTFQTAKLNAEIAWKTAKLAADTTWRSAKLACGPVTSQ